MKRLYVLSLILILGAGSCLFAQPSLDSLLFRVEINNPALISAKNLLKSQKLEARTGLTPVNPEVDIAYLWGSSKELGDRQDFAVTQSFDFPTVYSSRSKLSKLNLTQAELEYKASRQEILLKAHQVWIQKVYLNKLASLLNRRLLYAKKVSDGFDRKLEAGEANQLDVNQARIKVVALENELNFVYREFSKNKAEILTLTGELNVVINDTIVNESPPIIIDTLLKHYEQGFINQMYATEIEKKSREVNVVFNQKLPKLKAGYYQEKILGTKLSGVTAGITIPLWENARAVNTAKAKLAFAESDAERYWLKLKNDVLQKFEQFNFLNERVEAMEGLISTTDSFSLLNQAMESGEISLTQFFYETDFYIGNIISFLEFEKEMLLLKADLRKVYY